MKASISTVASALLALGALGCQVQSSLGAGGTGPGQPPPAGPPPASASGATDPGAAGPAVNPDCPNPENHCLEDGIYLISDKDLNAAWIYVEPATAKGEVVDGEASFFNLREAKDEVTAYHWLTRPATDADLQVGRRIFLLHQRDGDLYRSPKTRQEAMSTRWWMTTIASTAALPHGELLVTGGYKVSRDAIRVADALPAAGVSADLANGEDAHFLTAGHWLVADKPLTAKWMYAEVAAPIKEPSAATKGDGQFISLRDGKVAWSKHAWRTRPATQADLKPGTQVFMVHERDGQSYRKPKDRIEGLTHRWWTAKIIDASQLYKGMVTVGGGYVVNVDALRVAN